MFKIRAPSQLQQRSLQVLLLGECYLHSMLNLPAGLTPSMIKATH
jgi:hypothetical protein